MTAVAYPNIKNRMNMIETHHVSDLIKTLSGNDVFSCFILNIDEYKIF